MLAILAQTAGLFYWGGKVYEMLRDHDRRITDLEEIHKYQHHRRKDD